MNLVGDRSASILLPAFLAGLLVLATHVPLGAQVLQRGIVFIDLAIAQIAGARRDRRRRWSSIEPQRLAVQVAAARRRAAGALLLTWTEKRWPEVQEAQIGVAVRARGDRRHPAARAQPARRRAPARPAGRADPVGRRIAQLVVPADRRAS